MDWKWSCDEASSVLHIKKKTHTMKFDDRLLRSSHKRSLNSANPFPPLLINQRYWHTFDVLHSLWNLLHRNILLLSNILALFCYSSTILFCVISPVKIIVCCELVYYVYQSDIRMLLSAHVWSTTTYACNYTHITPWIYITFSIHYYIFHIGSQELLNVFILDVI